MAKCTVVSLIPLDIREEKPGLIPNTYELPASDGKTPTILVVDNAIRFIYIDYERGAEPVPVLSNEIAASVVNDYCRSLMCYRPEERREAAPGMFWVEGAYTLEEIEKKFAKELAKAKFEQKAWFEELVKIADDEWARIGSHRAIATVQRRAAEFLNLQRPWLSEQVPDAFIACPFCTTRISSIAVVCPQCNNILNKERYAALSPAAQAK